MNASRRRFLKTLSLGAAALPFSACETLKTAAPGNEPVEQGAQGSVVGSVRDLGVQFRNNRVDITGQDGATSVVLPDGRALWVFGDTIEGPFETIRDHDLTHVLSNTASLVPSQNSTHGIKQFEYLKSADGKRPRQIIQFAADEDKARHRLWAIHGVCVNEHVYLFYHKITMDPEVDVFETFQLNGMGIARAKVGEFDFERLKAPDGSREFWKGDAPGFGVFVEKLDDGFIYLWGSLMTGMFLARTKPETIENLEGYEYLVAAPTPKEPNITPQWGKSFKPTAVLFDAVPNEMSAGYNPYLKKHIAIHTYNRENKLVIRTAPRITGPWSEPEIFHRPTKKGEADLFNAGKEHPELAREGGRILYATYINSSVYMPHLLEITLA